MSGKLSTTTADMEVEIELFECLACSSESSVPTCRRPGDTMEGLIHVSSKSPMRLISLEVHFRGQTEAMLCLLQESDPA
jgi:hypothetical protein